jgi:hypothetical protein
LWSTRGEGASTTWRRVEGESVSGHDLGVRRLTRSRPEQRSWTNGSVDGLRGREVEMKIDLSLAVGSSEDRCCVVVGRIYLDLARVARHARELASDFDGWQRGEEAGDAYGETAPTTTMRLMCWRDGTGGGGSLKSVLFIHRLREGSGTVTTPD